MGLEQSGWRMFLNSLLPWVNLPNSQNDNNVNEDPNMPDIQEDD